MANMFEFYLDLDGGDKGDHIQLKAPSAMSDSDLLRFVSLAMVSRRSGDKSVPFNGAAYAARLAGVSMLLTEVETLVQEELRQEFGIYVAIDRVERLNFLKTEKPKPKLWETAKEYVLDNLPVIVPFTLALAMISAMLWDALNA